jgi:hypothetical protein
MILKDGVRKDDCGKFIFDKKVDLDTDIIELTKDISGIKHTHNLTYIYAYEFRNGIDSKVQKEFRDALKYNIENTNYYYTDEVHDFVEDGVFRLDEYKRIDTFKVLVSVKPTFTEHNTLLDWITIFINEYSSTSIISFELLKKIVKEVRFDKQKAFDALKRTNKYGNKTDEYLWKLVNKINIQFQQANPISLFKIKEYVPVVIREGFIDYLKFRNDEEKEIYCNLTKGTEVLIIDDFITSGSTLKEIIRFLNTINPNNNITAFAFINQLREY